MGTPTNKQELLNEIETAHQDMMRLLAAMSDDELTAPTLDGGWSPKDALSHILAWEKMAMDWLTRSVQGEHVQRFIPGFLYDTEAEREPTMERLNTFLFERDQNRPLADVLQDFRATHKAFFELVAQTDEQDIFDPHRFAWRNGSPALDMIAANTIDHYREHGDAIWQAHITAP